MKFVKWKEIHWDIVRSYLRTPWVLLGWPISIHRTVSPVLVRTGESELVYDGPLRKYVEIRVPFTPMVTWTWDGEYKTKQEMYPVISHRTVRFYWYGFFWFWRG